MIGAVGGLFAIGGAELLERLKIDDPVGECENDSWRLKIDDLPVSVRTTPGDTQNQNR